MSLLLTSSAMAFLIACGSSTAQRQTSQKAAIPAPSVAATESRVVTLPAVPRDLTDADFEQHVKDLQTRIQTKLHSHDFSIVIQRPFVVVGDESASAVQEHAIHTVKWAVDRLKQDYFKKDPDEILEIWLFKDNSSYRRNAKLMFDDDPTTPYGYYSRADNALIMNISTGSGTLVHEIVHPLMQANFPECPPWFNEGMGSLFEQSGEETGHIRGYINWRLPGLKRAIEEKRVASFETLTSMDARTFYNDNGGECYAQARYLCFYLQEKGLLQKFYRDFVTNQSKDPSGYKTLQRVLRETDMDAFKTRWEKYVMSLSQGYSVDIR